MYCGKCGMKVDKTDMYCHNCGAPVNGNEEQNSYMDNSYYTENKFNESYVPTEEDKKKKRNAIIVAVLAGGLSVLSMVGIIVFCIVMFFTTFDEVKHDVYLSIGDSQVRNFFNVVEEGDLCGFNTNSLYRHNHLEHSIEISVCSYDNFSEEIDAYFNYMEKEYGFVEISDRYRRVMVGRDGDTDYVIEISVDYDDLVITYRRYYDENFDATIKDIEDDAAIDGKWNGSTDV